jgi:hypothetical protein
MLGYTKWDAFTIHHLPSTDVSVVGFLKEKGAIMINGLLSTRIKDSIHSHTLLTDDFDIYEKMIETTNQKEHSVETFKELIATFDISKIGEIKVLGVLQSNNIFVQDGNHRIAIILHKSLYPIGFPNSFLKITFGPLCLDAIGKALKATTAGHLYNGWHNNRAMYGYHSFFIHNLKFRGQRNPVQRLEKIRKFVNFENKKVLDLGCNTGGMLLHLPEISVGCGIDLDEKCLSAANLIKNKLNYVADIQFKKCNLNEFKIEEFIKENFQPDYIFLLSLGSWVADWPTLYNECFNNTPNIILETNNDKEGVYQLALFEKLGAKITMISDKSDDDITGNHLRKTYLVEKCVV